MSLLRIIFAVLSIALLGASSMSADTYTKREMRSVWLTTVYAIDWPSTQGTTASAQTSQKNEMTGYLDQLQADGFNAVFFQVRSMCDAMYQSSYEPWSSYLTGSRGSNPGWDPLAFVVEECHKRGIECHAWVNPYRWSTGSNWSTTQDQQLSSSGWLLSYTSTSDNNGTASTITILNPGIPAARQRIVDVCREIVNNYDVDGLVFDDYFYPNGIPSTSSAGDYNLWKNSGSGLSIGDWRRKNVNQMVADVYNMIQETKPWVRFGISPAGAACSSSSVAAKHGVEPLSNYCSASDWQYDGIFSDPVAWLEEGTIDYISPQLYWTTSHSTNPFGPMTNWWSKVAKQFGRHHYASHSITFLESANTTSSYQEVGKQVQLSRDYTLNNATGCVFYSHNKISGKTVSGLGEWLLANKFQKKALPPAIDWKTATNPGKVSNLSTAPDANGGIFWNTPGDGYRYSVYAIPSSVSKSTIMSSVDGGILSDYLVGIYYSGYCYLPAEKVSGYYYAVCVLDRYGNEYEPRYSTDNVTPAEKVTLTSPVGGATVKQPVTFAWSAAASAATYTLQVSKSSDITNPVINRSGITTNSLSLNAGDLDESTTYYWRIVTSQTGKEDAASDVAQFATAQFDAISPLSLSSPVNAATVPDEASISFAWNGVEGASYKLEIALDATFDQIVVSQNTTSTGATVDMSKLQYNGTYYWRITATKAGYKTTTTLAWTFNTPKREAAPKVTLVTPENNATITEAFTFAFTNLAADSYRLIVSTSAQFTEPLIDTTTGFTTSSGTKKYSVSESDLPRGTYYWKVISSKAGSLDTDSEVRKFTFQIAGNEAGYEIKKDPATYNSQQSVALTNLWMRSVDSEFSNLPDNTDWALNRSMCVIDNIIYISARSANSSTADCYVDRYNALTGEFISSLALSSDVQCSYFPCNDVMKDNAGNLIVSNLTLNLSTTPLKLYNINKANGNATLAASLSYSGGGRVDHCAVYGDVNSYPFYVFAGLSATNQVVRWTVNSASDITSEIVTLKAVYPSSSQFSNISIRVFPVDENTFYVNSAATMPSRYSFSTGSMLDSFNNASAEAIPENEYANGMTFFTYNNVNYMVYPNNPVYQTGDSNNYGGPNDFIIATADNNWNYSSLAAKWTVPQGGLGSEYSFYADALVDHETVTNSSDNTKSSENVYFYVPANGIAAYQIQHQIFTDAVTLIENNEWIVNYAAGAVTSSRRADIAIYDINSRLVASAKNVTELNLSSLAHGIFIAVCHSDGETKTLKLVR